MGVRLGGGGRAGTEGIIPVLGGGREGGKGRWDGKRGVGAGTGLRHYICVTINRDVHPYTVTIAWHVTINTYEVNDLHHKSSGAV